MQQNNQVNRYETKDCNCHMEGIVLLRRMDAKEKLLKKNVAEGVASAIVALGVKEPALMSALVECVCSNDTAMAIAQRYCIHPSTLSHYSKVVGLPKRRRGRRPNSQPTSMHQKILDLAKTHGLAGTARRIGVSKQWISYVVKKWGPGLKGPREPVEIVTPSPRKHGPRTVIVSFRLSDEEWQQLVSAKPKLASQKWSPGNHARAMVLEQIARLIPTHATSGASIGMDPTADITGRDNGALQAPRECNHE
jgi:hypothetical protein